MAELDTTFYDKDGHVIHPVLMNTAKDGTGTWYVALADASGRLILGTSTAEIGKLAANSGVDIGDVDVISLPSVSSATPTKKPIGSSDTQVIVANTSRKFASFVNDSDETIYLSLSDTAVMNEGHRLNARGGSYDINLMNLYTGEVSAICASGSKNLTVTEG